MSHDTHHEHSKENKSVISFKNSFWLVVILVGLFIAAVNFIQAESGGEEGKGEAKEKTEVKAKNESAAQAKAEPKAEAPQPAEAGKDSAAKDVK